MGRVLAAAGVMVLVGAAQERTKEPDGLYFFFAPDSPGIESIADGLAKTPARPVLLVSSFKGELPQPFLDAAKALGRDFAVVDEEGLALARKFGVARLPCVVRVHDGRVHMAAGSKLNLKEVLECSR